MGVPQNFSPYMSTQRAKDGGAQLPYNQAIYREFKKTKCPFEVGVVRERTSIIISGGSSIYIAAATFGEEAVAVTVDLCCDGACVFVFVIANVPVIDLMINAARDATQTHMDSFCPLPCQGWEPMPTMMSRTVAKSAKRRMG